MDSRKLKLTFVTLFVIWLASGYYFWEKYLNEHYLGSYDQYGLPIQLSNPGYDLVYHAWFLWAFPLITLFIPMLYWSLSNIVKFKALSKTLASKCDRLEIEINAKDYELKSKIEEFDRKEQEYIINEQKNETESLREYNEVYASFKEHQIEHQKLQNNYLQLEKKLQNLQIDYKKSLQFIEKLLAKIKKE